MIGVAAIARRATRGRVTRPLTWAASAVVVVVCTQFVFGRVDIGLRPSFGLRASAIPVGVLVNGMVIGSLYGLLAMGLVLVYRGNRIVNFAQGSLGAAPAVLALTLLSQRHVPYLAALVIALVGAALMGCLVETVLIRRFRRSPRLILTVATIGVGQILTFLELSIPDWISSGPVPVNMFPTPFEGLAFNIGIVRFTGDHVFTVTVVAAVLVGLGVFLRSTSAGIAIRGVAENADRASLLGIPIHRIGMVSWAVAAMVSGIAVFLRGPLVGTSLAGAISPSVLLYGLAAAVIAKMESLPVAVAAGMAIGVVDQAAVFSTRRSVVVQAVMLLVILAALLVQRRAFSRTGHSGAESWQATKELRRIPVELRRLPEVIALRAALGVAAVALAVGAPFIFGVHPHGGSIPTLVVIYAMVGVSLVILTGWTGQISLGQFALSGVGAAVAGGLSTRANADFFVCLVAAGLVGAVVAVVIGLPALRVPGLLLAVATLAFAFSVYNLVLNREYFAWLLPGSLDVVERPILWGRFDTTSSIRFYYVCLVFLALSLLVATALRRNRSGRIFIGVRSNERMMQSYGVNPARTRLAAFGISGFIAAFAGGLLAFQLGSVDQEVFTPLRSIDVFVMAVIGGINSVPGAVVGAIYMFGVPQLPGLREVDSISFLTTGVGVFVLLLFVPGGFAEVGNRVRDQLLRWLAHRRRMLVPSIVADRSSQDANVALTPVIDHAIATSNGDRRIDEDRPAAREHV